MFIVSSDWHCPPDGLIPQAKKLIEKAKPGEDILVGVGDLFDFIPLGMDKFKNSKAIDSFIELLGGQTFYYVGGNHDPYRWVRKRLKDYPNIKVSRTLNWENKLYFRHGHGWSADWRFLRHFAPQFVEFMTEYLPGPWYRFCKWVGWMPSERKKKSDAGGPKERKKYDDAVRIVWRFAIRHAQHNSLSVVVGHTHCSATLRRAANGVKTVMADGGKLEEKTYLEIDDDIQLCTLP